MTRRIATGGSGGKAATTTPAAIDANTNTERPCQPAATLTLPAA